MLSLNLSFSKQKTKLNKYFASQSNSRSKQREWMNLTSICTGTCPKIPFLSVLQNSSSFLVTQRGQRFFFNLIFKRNVIYEVSNATLGQHHLTTLYAKVSRKWGEKFRTLTFWKTRQSVGTLLWMAYIVIASPIYYKQHQLSTW